MGGPPADPAAQMLTRVLGEPNLCVAAAGAHCFYDLLESSKLNIHVYHFYWIHLKLTFE